MKINAYWVKYVIVVIVFHVIILVINVTMQVGVTNVGDVKERQIQINQLTNRAAQLIILI